MAVVKGVKEKPSKAKKKEISKEETVIRYSFMALGAIIAVLSLYFIIINLIPKNYIKVGNQKIGEAEYLYKTNLQYNIFMNSNQDIIAALGYDISTQSGLMNFMKSAYDNQRSFGQLLLEQVNDGIQRNIILLDLIKETGFVIDEQELEESYNIQLENLQKIADEEGYSLDDFAHQYYGSDFKTMQSVIRETLRVQQYMTYLDEQYLSEIDDGRALAYYDSADSEGYKTRDEIDKVTVILVIKRTVDDYYNALAEDVRDAAKIKAEEVYRLALEGHDMNELAKLYSDEFAVDDDEIEGDVEEDEIPDDQKGVYIFAKSEIQLSALSEWAFNAQPGDVDLLETDIGYLVVKFIKRTEYEDVKDQVYSLIANSDYELKMKEYQQLPKYAIGLYRPYQELYLNYTTTN